MYFKNLPKVSYRFGDNEASSLFNNLSAYVDIIDQVRQEIAFYEKYTILDGDRPDVISQKLYGTPEYHWTLFMMNDGLRESGWPVPESKLRILVQSRYPHRTVTTESDIASFFLPGVSVLGKTSGTTGRIIERNLDLGQLVIATDKNEAGVNNTFNSTEQIAAGDTVEEQTDNIALSINETAQYNSVLYYKNSNGDIVDIDPYNQVTTGLTPVTIMEDNINFNNKLREIVVIKPSQINAVVNEYFRLMRK